MMIHNIFVFLIFFIFVIFIHVASEFFAHRSCFVARKTGKKICACWDCKNPCNLSKYTGKTNADKIRSMTNEELAAAILHVNDIDIESVIPFCKEYDECMDALASGQSVPEGKCMECMMNWLDQEVSNNDV